ncbi:MAG: hypothetical protein ACLFQE_08435, partial [Thermotogota bacterium]
MKKVLYSLLSVVMIALFLVSCAGGGGIQLIVEFSDNFDENEFSEDWNTSGDSAPTLQDEEAFEGEKSVKFSNIGVGEVSTLSLEINLEDDSVLDFYINTRTGSDGNYFKLYIDGKSSGEWFWGHDEDWKKIIRRISKGQHTITWQFEVNHLGSPEQESEIYVYLDNVRIVKSTGYDLGQEVEFPDETFKNAVLNVIGLAEITNREDVS